MLQDVLGFGRSARRLFAYRGRSSHIALAEIPRSRGRSSLACPELLCRDRERHVMLHQFEMPDFFGLQAMFKEPAGATKIDPLGNRLPRKHTLSELLAQYALGPPGDRERLSILLQRAASRLGPPERMAGLRDASMTAHARRRCRARSRLRGRKRGSRNPGQTCDHLRAKRPGFPRGRAADRQSFAEAPLCECTVRACHRDRPSNAEDRRALSGRTDVGAAGGLLLHHHGSKARPARLR